jgi:uncharacterized protein
MRCPNDDTPLAISDRQGIEIDYCPECRGVWLDRGELDKLIERSMAFADPPAAPERRPSRQSDDHYDDRDRSRSGKKSKKSSFLSEIFEMGG